MAQIHHSKNGLQAQLDRIEKRRTTKLIAGILFGILLIIGCIWFGSEAACNSIDRKLHAPDRLEANVFFMMFLFLVDLIQIPFQYFGIVFVIIIAVSLYKWCKESSRCSSEEEILRNGLSGEQKALGILSSLPHSYHLFTNLFIPYDGKTSETDLVAVGPAGVFIIEVKNYSGRLEGDWSNEHLSQIKDERYVKRPYNPVKQVATHVFRLSHFLQEKGIRAWVQSAVLFTDPALQLNVTDREGKNPLVFAGADRSKLVSTIQEKPVALSDEQVGRIVRLMDALCAS